MLWEELKRFSTEELEGPGRLSFPFLLYRNQICIQGISEGTRKGGTDVFTSVLFVDYMFHESIWYRNTRRAFSETISPLVHRRNSNLSSHSTFTLCSLNIVCAYSALNEDQIKMIFVLSSLRCVAAYARLFRSSVTTFISVPSISLHFVCTVLYVRLWVVVVFVSVIKVLLGIKVLFI